MVIYRCRDGCHAVLVTYAEPDDPLKMRAVCTLIPDRQKPTHFAGIDRLEAVRAEFPMLEWITVSGPIIEKMQRPAPNPWRCWLPEIQGAASQPLTPVFVRIVPEYQPQPPLHCSPI